MTNEHTVFSGAERAADFVEEVAPSVSESPKGSAAADANASSGQQAEATLEGDTNTARAVSAPAPEVEAPAQPVDPSRLVVSAMRSGSSAAPSSSDQLRARKGARGFFARMGLPVAPGEVERAAIEAEAQHAAELDDARRVIRQATWTRAVSVLVGNPKGGTGKTPLALLLGGTLAAIRGGDVGIVEVSDDPGALGYRAEGTPSLGLGEFVRDLDQLATKGQVTGYTAPQTSFASVIGTVEGHPRPPLSYEAVVAVAAKLDEHFEVRVMDSGNQPSSGAFQAAADTADVLVIPVMNAGDSTLEALGMLAALRRTEAGRRLADTAIAVVMDDGRPQDQRMKETVPQALEGAGVRTVHRVPYDDHIATRGEVTLGRVNAAATEALTLLGADVIRALTAAAVPQGRRVQTTTTESKDENR